MTNKRPHGVETFWLLFAVGAAALFARTPAQAAYIIFGVYVFFELCDRIERFISGL